MVLAGFQLLLEVPDLRSGFVAPWARGTSTGPFWRSGIRTDPVRVCAPFQLTVAKNPREARSLSDSAYEPGVSLSKSEKCASQGVLLKRSAQEEQGTDVLAPGPPDRRLREEPK